MNYLRFNLKCIFIKNVIESLFMPLGNGINGADILIVLIADEFKTLYMEDLSIFSKTKSPSLSILNNTFTFPSIPCLLAYLG